MMDDASGKTESVKNDPGELARVLELELMQKRAAWQRATARYRALRTISVIFLFLVITASIAGFFLICSRAHESHAPQPDTAPSVAPSR